MNSHQRKKLKTISKFVYRSYPKWREKFGDNICGIHVGKKEKDGKKTRFYSIVFHVYKKRKNPKVKIPESITVNIPKEGKKKIPTDVKEYGRLKLTGYRIGDIIHSQPVKPGSIGIFFRRENRFYACSNMHVLSPYLISMGIYKYDRHFDHANAPGIIIRNQTGNIQGILERAIFERHDLGVAEIIGPGLQNIIGNTNFSPNGHRALTRNDIGMPVKTFSAVSHNLQFGKVKDLWGIQTVPGSAFGDPTAPPKNFYDIVVTDIHVSLGDSGAGLFSINNEFLGILFAKDDSVGESYFFHLNALGLIFRGFEPLT